ncbi:hypothetical protein ACMV5I_27625, partial [Serratia sp. T13T92]|uniref:hypothetical protein n=1 Tax=Serratia sp. T13T92 TaxID=3397496 RepID=UPI0039E072FE
LADFIMVRVVKTQKETEYMPAIPVHLFQENTGVIGSVHICAIRAPKDGFTACRRSAWLPSVAPLFTATHRIYLIVFK